MRLRCSLSACASILACCAFATEASAQQVGGNFSVNHFNPSERGSEWFVLDSLDLRGSLRPVVGVVGDWAARPLVVYNGDGSLQSSIVRNQATLHAGASVALWERVRLGLDAPLQIYADGQRGDLGGGVLVLPPAHSAALGDLRFSADVRVLGDYGTPFTAAAGASLWIPTGDPKSYSGDRSVRLAPHVLVAGELGMFVYAGSAAVVYRGTDGFGDHAVGTEVTAGVAAGIRLMDRKLVLGPELFGDTVVASSDSAFSRRATPLEGLLGAHLSIGDSLRIGAGAGTGLARGYGAPTFRGILSAEWTPAPTRDEPPPPAVMSEPGDRDKDGILDAEDACPDVPGSPSAERASRGCPVVADADGDSISDAADACRDTAGFASDDPAKNGCPPLLDTDQDGVLDADDACPAISGLKTATPSTNGCPDLDRDKDGIANESDACPDVAGPADPSAKSNGCPKAFIQADQIVIRDQVKFGLGSSRILPGKENQEVLESVLAVLNEHPGLQGLRIEGYSDSVGPAEQNKALSKYRAHSVLEWFATHGVDRKRLQSVGLGAEKPIDSNDTAEGRGNNRRVEFHILGGAPGAAPESAPAPKGTP